nr:AMP-dependent synthetase/ligase [Microbacterium amylolyticum]
MVPADPERNISDLLADRAKKTPNKPLFGIPDGNDGWRDKTAREFEAEVIALAKGFVAAGVHPGDKVGFLARTTYEWTLVDFALFYAGAIMVPVYETSSPSQVQWILSDSGATALMVETAEHDARFSEVRNELPLIDAYWRMDQGALDTLVAQGAEIDDEEIQRRRKLARADDIATIIYTSGSTGRPKGCVLTHSNFVDLVQNSGTSLNEIVTQSDASTVLFITTAHVFARFMSIFYIHWAVKTGHEPNTKNLVNTLGSFKPTVLLAVPRVFEKVYNAAAQKTEAEGKGAIFRRAAKIGIEHARREQEGEKIGPLLALQFALYNKLVFSKLRERMGGKVTYAVSGSAPLGPHLGYFFRGLGIKILEGYGLTETTAPATVNVTERIKVGTVGPPLPGVSIRIADDGEVQVKGINVFREYWRNPEATEDAFDGDWFRTGDIGALDDDGYLAITGRKKEIIVTAGGKNVAPTVLEDPIRSNPIVGQVVVVGDQKPFISALITLDPEMLPAWLATHGESSELTLEQAAINPTVRGEVQRQIDEANSRVSRAESVREFVILPTEWTEATGHLTPKMSIKRAEIVRDFADEIEKIYSAPRDVTTGIPIGG